MDGEVFFTDAVYQPIEDHGLDINPDTDLNPISTATNEPKKEATKKPARDFSNQKKITQRIRQFIEDDNLARITKPIKKPKPGQLSSGLRRMKHDIVGLAKIAPRIQSSVIGPARLKVAERAKLKELRDVATTVEIETNTPVAPLMLYPKETDLFSFRAPGYDIHTPLGNTSADIRRSKIYKKATELAEIDSVIKKLDTAIIDLKMDSLRNLRTPRYIKEPLNFEEPSQDDEENGETCARIRPLLKVIRRPLIEANLMVNNKPSTSNSIIRDNNPVASLAAVHSDVNAEYSLYGDIRPETFIQEEMARRGYQHCTDQLSRIAAMAEGLEKNKKIITDENDSSKSKKKNHRKSETTEKGGEMIKMVIKRIVPPNGKNMNQEATYSIAKKEEPVESKKKQPKKPPAKRPSTEGKTSRKQSISKKSDGIPRKKIKLSFNNSKSTIKSWGAS